MNDFIVTIANKGISIDLCIVYGYTPDFVTLNSERIKIFTRYRADQTYFSDMNQFIIFNEYPDNLIKAIYKEVE